MILSLIPANIGLLVHITIDGQCHSGITLNVIKDDGYDPSLHTTPRPPLIHAIVKTPTMIYVVPDLIPYHPHHDKLNMTWHFSHHISPEGNDATGHYETQRLRETAG